MEFLKLAAYHLARNYREQYNIYISVGILYNHESPRRGHQFVTRKISSAVAKIYLGKSDKLEIGNLESLRDWGYAPDYVIAMHAMLQLEKPDDFVISTGVLHSVKDFLVEAFTFVNLDYTKFIYLNQNLFRPGEITSLCGDSTKAKNILNWEAKTSFKSIVREMVLSDIQNIKEIIN